jgi:brefeldin A-resistance guanine nucleotide exchange factor 1
LVLFSRVLLTGLFLRPIAFDFLCKVLGSANSFSSLFNERVVASLLRLALLVIKHDDLRDSTFLALDSLRSLSPPVLASVAEPLMAGLSTLFIENADRIKYAFLPCIPTRGAD